MKIFVGWALLPIRVIITIIMAIINMTIHTIDFLLKKKTFIPPTPYYKKYAEG